MPPHSRFVKRGLFGHSPLRRAGYNTLPHTLNIIRPLSPQGLPVCSPQHSSLTVLTPRSMVKALLPPLLIADCRGPGVTSGEQQLNLLVFQPN